MKPVTIVKLILIYIISLGAAVKGLPPNPHISDWVIAAGTSALPVLTFLDQSMSRDAEPQTVQVPVEAVTAKVVP